MKIVPNTLTNERTVVFIDYHNTHHVLRRLGRQIDLAALRSYLAEGRHLVETFLPDDPAPDGEVFAEPGDAPEAGFTPRLDRLTRLTETFKAQLEVKKVFEKPPHPLSPSPV